MSDIACWWVGLFAAVTAFGVLTDVAERWAERRAERNRAAADDAPSTRNLRRGVFPLTHADRTNEGA